MVNAKRLVITGHRGFVGRRLVAQAQSQGFQVLVFDGDLLKEQEVDLFCQALSSRDIIIHLAGSYFGSDMDVIEKNTIASFHLAKSLQVMPEVRIIVTSTGAVYGDSGNTPIGEVVPLNPNTVYGLAKKWNEEVFQFYSAQAKKNLVILRLASLYGPGNTKGVIHSMSHSIRVDSNLALNGSGDQRRSFLHVDDLCDALLMIVKSSITGVFNIAELQSYSIREVVDIFRSHVDFSIIKLPDENNLKSMVLDASCLFDALLWQPSHSLSSFIGNQEW
jgi:UDP-glucose 4-epimerase